MIETRTYTTFDSVHQSIVRNKGLYEQVLVLRYTTTSSCWRTVSLFCVRSLFLSPLVDLTRSCWFLGQQPSSTLVGAVACGTASCPLRLVCVLVCMHVQDRRSSIQTRRHPFQGPSRRMGPSPLVLQERTDETIFFSLFLRIKHNNSV